MINSTVVFHEQLRRHLKFIGASCLAYDRGDHEEALRIAVSLRVLFHDTVQSTSLLTHLGLKSTINILSSFGLGKTSDELGAARIFSVTMMLTQDGVSPPLGDSSVKRLVSCSDWWNEVVIAESTHISRRDVVLSAANQDGGAHVDSRPSSKTLALQKGVGTFTQVRGGVATSWELDNHHFPLIRQMGYEVLNSSELTGAP